MQKHSLRQRFEAKCDRRAPNECWIWKASINNKGYGLLSPGGTTHKKLAHRISYELFIGPIPEDTLVLHQCDNPRCVNPEHLFLGTHKDNYDDMVRKGRRRVVINPNNKPPSFKGENHPIAKLSEKDVVEARALYAAGVPLSQIIAKFPVGKRTIQRAVRGLSWRHSPGPVSPSKIDIAKSYHGSVHANSKLTEAIVAEARTRFAAGEPCYRLAAEFGVSPSVMQDAVMRRSWKHVP